MIISSLEHISEFHHSFSSNVGISSLVTEFISRTSFWVLFCRTKWFNVIIIKLLVLPLNCFKRAIFSGKIPCLVINIFPGYGSGSVVRNMMFLQYLYSGSSILQIHLRNYETTTWISYPCHILIGHLFQQSYDDALFSS